MAMVRFISPTGNTFKANLSRARQQDQVGSSTIMVLTMREVLMTTELAVKENICQNKLVLRAHGKIPSPLLVYIV
jgi:hypothetical protein